MRTRVAAAHVVATVSAAPELAGGGGSCGGAAVLEVGSAPFLLTHALHRDGFDIHGVDVAPERFGAALAREGVDATRIRIYPLAALDDSTTADVDESLWSGNAWQTDKLVGLEQAAGFWFTGGDQMRIVGSMRAEDGEESPLLGLIHRRLAAGAVVDGTSAGAAVMSRAMIAGGDSFNALLEPLAQSYASTEDQDSGRLYLENGLGFLADGIVDQHFDRKARLGAAADQPQRFKYRKLK